MSINYPCETCTIVGHIKVDHVNSSAGNSISVKKSCNNDCDLYRDWLISQGYIDITTVQKMFHAYNTPDLAKKCNCSGIEGREFRTIPLDPPPGKLVVSVPKEPLLTPEQEAYVLKKMLESVPKEICLEFVGNFIDTTK